MFRDVELVQKNLSKQKKKVEALETRQEEAEANIVVLKREMEALKREIAAGGNGNGTGKSELSKPTPSQREIVWEVSEDVVLLCIFKSANIFSSFSLSFLRLILIWVKINDSKVITFALEINCGEF